MRALFIAAVLSAVVSFAADPTSTTGDAVQAPVAPPAAPKTEKQQRIDLQRQEIDDMPNKEKLEQTEKGLDRMRQALKETIDKLEEARNTKDVVKLNCVNEKLTQIKGLVRISEQASVALQEAVAANDKKAAGDEYFKVAIAYKRTNELRSEAEQCIGQLAFRVDERVMLDVDEPDDLPKGDPSKVLPVSPPPVRQPPASPTM
ncbi:MAG: hypothetical protein K1X89_02095 [Myxococcaceae bacterium]|nr:hypothetical protein [Myxococcaceae bacterium]